MSLRPCTACARLVREARCPFCDGLARPVAARAAATGRWPRAVLIAGAAASVSVAGACGAPQVSMYGGPPVVQDDASAPPPQPSATTAPSASAPEPNPVTAPAYGFPPAPIPSTRGSK